MSRIRDLARMALMVTGVGTTACVSSTLRGTNTAHVLDSTAVGAMAAPTSGELRWPTAASLDSGWVVAANRFPSGADAVIGRRALYLAHSRTGPLPLPDGDFLFAYPLVRAGADSALHLFWAEGQGSSVIAGWPSNLTAIWHATLKNERWSAPERVIDGKWLSWNARAPQVATDDSGRFHLLITATVSGRPEETYHIVREATGWERRGTGMHALYPVLASTGGGQFIMAYVDTERGATNQLYTRVSADNGRTWGEAARVLPISQIAPVYAPQLRVVGDSVYLSWIGETPGGDSWGITRRAITRTSGASEWAVPLWSPAIDGALLTVTFAVSGCESIRALAEIVTPQQRAAVGEFHVRGDRMTFEQPLADAFAIASLIDRSENRIIALWNAMPANTRLARPFFRELPVCH